jgi:hypothetical protein
MRLYPLTSCICTRSGLDARPTSVEPIFNEDSLFKKDLPIAR